VFRKFHAFVLAAFIASATTACAPVSKQPVISNEQARKEAEIQRKMAEDWQVEKQTQQSQERMKYWARGIDIWYRITGANAPLCGENVTNTMGALLAMASKKDTLEARTYNRVNNLSPTNPTVLAVAAGSPADKAGLHIGDRITVVDGKRVSTADFDREVPANRRARLEIERNGKKIGKWITPEKSCDYGFTIKKEDTINAYATGKDVVIFTGIMDFSSSDQELALVLSHELAHNTMGHIQKKQGNSILGSLLGTALDVAAGTNVFGRLGGGIGGGAYSQGFEGEADYVGMYYAARAGYDMSDAANMWRRMGAANPKSIGLEGSTHPSTAKRFLAIQQTAKEISEKRARKQPLIPDMKDK